MPNEKFPHSSKLDSGRVNSLAAKRRRKSASVPFRMVTLPPIAKPGRKPQPEILFCVMVFTGGTGDSRSKSFRPFFSNSSSFPAPTCKVIVAIWMALMTFTAAAAERFPPSTFLDGCAGVMVSVFSVRISPRKPVFLLLCCRRQRGTQWLCQFLFHQGHKQLLSI